MLPVCLSITYVFVAMPSQKTPFGMWASPTHPRNLPPPPPFSFIVSFFFPLVAEMRWGGSDSGGEAQSAASALGPLWRTLEQLDHLALIKGWLGGWGGGGQLAEFVASEFARSELWHSAYPTIWRKQRLSWEVETQRLPMKSRTDLISSRGRPSLLTFTLPRVSSIRQPGHLSPNLVPPCNHQAWPWFSSPAFFGRWSSRLGWSHP